MGKSMAAAAVSHAGAVPIVNLAHLAIGAKSLTGLLTQVLGFAQAGQFVDDLHNGQSCLILDSLDEAHLAAGPQHFNAFIDDIVNIVGGGQSSSQIVIFGRRDTIETASMILDEFGIAPERLTVEPLDYQSSCNLVDLVLDHQNLDGRPYDIHRVHREPFGRFRDSYFGDLAGALGAEDGTIEERWPEIRAFLGYPPVLLALAKRLVERNPGTAADRIGRESNSSTRGELLKRVVEELLTRESHKVRSQLASPLGLAATSPTLDLIYTHEEQIVRILAYSEGQSPAIQMPASLSATQAATYETLVQTFVPDHPFLDGRNVENVVFRDYLNAFDVTSATISLHGVDHPPVDATVVGPFFAHFVHAMAENVEASEAIWGDRVAAVPERLLDPLVKSFALGAPSTSTFLYTERIASANRPPHLTIADDPIEDEPDRTGSLLFFDITDSSGLLEFTSPLARGNIITYGSVQIGSSSDDVVMGPDLLILCEELHLGGRRVSAIGQEESHTLASGGVVLMASEGFHHRHDLMVSAHPESCLRVVGSGAWHQWRAFTPASESIGGGARVSARLSWQVMFGLRRILLQFQKSASREPSLYYERLERVTIGGNDVFAATLRGLLEIEVVLREGNLYRLDLGALAEFDVNYAAVRGNDFETVLAPLHQRLLETTALRDLMEQEG